MEVGETGMHQGHSNKKRSILSEWGLWYLILPAALLSGILYYRLIDLPNTERRMILHQQICLGEAESPYRYRILVPYTTELLIQLLSHWLSYTTAFRLVYAFYDIVSLFLFFGALYYWLRLWHSPERSLLGVLFACATAPVAYWHHHFQPWSLLEAALFTIGLIFVVNNQKFYILFILFIYTLLRETSIFLPLAYFVSRYSTPSRRAEDSDWRLWAAIFFGTWFLIYGGLRLYLGHAPHVNSLTELIGINFSSRNLIITPVYVFIMFGGFVALAKRGYAFAPLPLRKVSLVIVPYLVIIGIWAIWSEVRCLMPLYPIVIALGLYGIDSVLSGSTDSSESR
jgi:hypothetical protein